jgi:capsular exopolysaccharide synthesis family protein
MSRIHEALKRAEQERAASQGGRVDSAPVMDLPASPEPLPGTAEAADATRTAPTAPVPGAPGNGQKVPSFATSFTFDTLLARSAQADWKPDPTTMLFFSQEDNALGTEQFRTLRSRLYQLREKISLKKILITSALPQEGKSFVAANLAQVLVRQHGRRVLLIDGDLRVARLHTALGTTSSPGLADYLLGESDEFSIMQRGPMENLFFLPCGRTVAHPAELIANGRLKMLLQRVEPLFDWIILDSPPAVPVSDASQLANFCDGVLMVVRSNATPYDTAQKARQEFQGKTLVGVVLNGITRGDSYSRYYYEAYEKTAKPKA